MKNDQLELYLYELEKSLKDFSPSSRAKIILENHTHINEAKEKFPDKSLSAILDDLGPAQTVANHYRLDSGFKTYKPKKHPFLKWMSITIMGSFALFLIFAGLLVWKFTPLAKFDEENQRMILLGGLIDINGTSGKIKVFDQYQFVENRFSNQFDGAFELTPDMNEIIVNFESGILNFKTTTSRKASWNCKLQIPPGKDIISMPPNALEINLEAYGGGSCDIEIPVDATLTAFGKDAQITLLDPLFDLFVEFENGSINFSPNPEV
ncbi:MAG: hypothetical protein WEB87_07530, partial [Bacteriovoracaceae bacterium]